jgi:hypothetical protein
MHGLLDRFERMVRRDRGTRDPDAQLALAVLRKRAHSSAHSLARTVERRLAALAGEARTEHQLQLPLDDAGEMDMSDEDPLLTARLLDDLDVERRLFDALREAAVRVSGHETKIRRLIRLLKALDRRNEPVVVFTEYRDTLHQLAQALPIRSLCLHGGMPRQERRMALDAFVRRTHTILLATDAAGEGLNLQAGCRTVVNLELPWNPNRLEQRIGRVDRIGQTRTVHVFHLIGARTAEVGMLARLRTRVEAARAEFDAVDPLVSSAASGPPTDIVPAASAGNRSWRWMPARAEAVAECARLERARALAHKKSTSHQITNSPNHQITKSPNEVHPGPLVCTTRRRRLKMALSGGLLVIVESVCHNACGSVIASRVIPLLVRLKCPISMHAPAFKQVLETLRLLAPCIAVPSQTDWERQIRECHHRFWTAEQARERSIARWLDGLQVSALQPGLFDQRAERERAVDQADRLDLQAALARRRALGNRLMELDPVQTCVRVVIGDHQLLGKPPAC